MPRLFEFWDAHEADREKFAIVTIHENGNTKQFSTVERELKKLERDVWNKRKFPFPILMAGGNTVQEWGVSGFPTLFLIDPEGKIAVKGHGEEVERRLEEELKKMPTPPKKDKPEAKEGEKKDSDDEDGDESESEDEKPVDPKKPADEKKPAEKPKTEPEKKEPPKKP